MCPADLDKTFLSAQLIQTQVHMMFNSPESHIFPSLETHAKHTDTGKITHHEHHNMTKSKWGGGRLGGEGRKVSEK